MTIVGRLVGALWAPPGCASPASCRSPAQRAGLAARNRRDLVDAMRDPRGKAGRVWVSDAQDIADKPRTVVDPITYVTDEVKVATTFRALHLALRDLHRPPLSFCREGAGTVSTTSGPASGDEGVSPMGSPRFPYQLGVG